MAKGFWRVLSGELMLDAGIALEVFAGWTGVGGAAGGMLISYGMSMMVSGIGTVLSGDTNHGISTSIRDPVAPWEAVYGETVTGGVCIYANQWGSATVNGSSVVTMLDMVFVVACHPCQSVNTVYIDRQRIQLNYGAIPTSALAGYSIPTVAANAGTSFTPAQQTVNINTISRSSNGVVTVVLPQDIPYLQAGDFVIVQNITGDPTLNGTFQVSQIISRVPVDGGPPTGTYILTFTYLSGGTVSSLSSQGQVVTKWASYDNCLYFEPLLGNQTLGETFVGMTVGTPYQGNGKLITPLSPQNAYDGSLTEEQAGIGPNPWTPYCSNVGKTMVFLRLQYAQNGKVKFTNGIPQFTFGMTGNNQIYDPRTSTLGDVSTYVYSNNAALCIADFLANGSATSAFPQGANAASWGFQASYGTDIPETQLIAAANVCDETIELALGGTEPQFTCNGKFSLNMRRGEILQNLLTSCAGRLVYAEGQYCIQPAQWVTPLTPHYDFYQHAAGSPKWQPTGTIRDQFNAVRWTYRSQYTGWVNSDGPYYAQDSEHGYSGPSEYNGDINMGADGGVRKWLDLQLPFTTSYSMGQRIAKIELLRRRYWGTGTFICDMTGYQFVPLDVIQANFSPLGWSGQILEVQAVRLRSERRDSGWIVATEIDVKTTDSSIYTWSTSEELQPQGYQDTTWPSNTVQEIVPFPWSPGYVAPLSGDVYEEALASATFGVQPLYGTDASGNGTINLLIKGTAPINTLDTEIEAPQITCTGSATGGYLASGTYVVALSARNSGSTPYQNTPYQALGTPFVPSSDSGVYWSGLSWGEAGWGTELGSITVTIQWGSGDVGGDLYLAGWTPDGYVFHWNQAVAASDSGSSTVVITTPTQSTAGGVDPIFDHFAVVWQQVVHTGPWAEQVQAVTATTVTINCPVADGTMTANQWAGYTLTLLAKDSAAVEIPVLNMPIVSSTASDDSGNFVLTIGTNSLGHNLPDLTTLLTVGDLVGVNFKPSFTSTSFTDANIANPYYPDGASGTVEAGHVVCVMSGEDAGDVVAISGVGDGGTTINLATSFEITPAAGDWVIVCEPANVPQVAGAPMVTSTALTGIMASPPVLNLEGAVWLFRVRTEDVNGNYGPDVLCPWRIVYLFGTPGMPGGLVYASTPS